MSMKASMPSRPSWWAKLAAITPGCELVGLRHTEIHLRIEGTLPCREGGSCGDHGVSLSFVKSRMRYRAAKNIGQAA